MLYMRIAYEIGHMSHDNKYKVGSIIVKDGQILSQGWNGMPSGMPNDMRWGDGKTKPHVIHSEANALMKLAKHGGNCNGATIYCTYSPCWGCAGLILQAGISRIVYDKIYDNEALEFIKERIEHERIAGSIAVSLRQGGQDVHQSPEGKLGCCTS